MRLSIRHRTEYRYSGPVSLGPQVIRLYPRAKADTVVDGFRLETTPQAKLRWVADVYENQAATFFEPAEATCLAISLEAELTITADNPFNFILDDSATQMPFTYPAGIAALVKPYAATHQFAGETEVFSWLCRAAPQTQGNTVDVLTGLNAAVRNGFTYVRRDEEGIQSPDETIRSGSGSCRDFAALFMAAVRMLGLAARFVSGYLYDPPEGEDHHFNRAVGSMHAWVEVYLPGAGWKGFDPTNGILANSYFIPTAVAINPEDAAPISGKYFAKTPTTSTMTTDLSIEEIT